ncbi:MAG: PQQ-binding-like beta-propeller repeat protein [Pseudomonadales bacterium]|nr:PQQ-binding-like beta-propeller repeat protein [Pseudomonadales bacterium]
MPARCCARIDGRPALLFNDRLSGLYAIDARSGERIWHAAVDDEPVPWYSGTPLVTSDTVYLPVASLEVGLAVNPLYGCCTTSGGIAAFDLRTGRKRWYLPTIPEPARETGSHWGFVQEYGPSRAAVWVPLHSMQRATACTSVPDRTFHIQPRPPAMRCLRSTPLLAISSGFGNSRPTMPTPLPATSRP